MKNYVIGAASVLLIVFFILAKPSAAQGVCFLYQDWDFGGREVSLTDGEEIRSFSNLNPPFNDQASSAKVIVPSGSTRCVLYTYQDDGFAGCRRTYSSDGSGQYTKFSKIHPNLIGAVRGALCEMDRNNQKKENDNASSASCRCDNVPPPPPSKCAGHSDDQMSEIDGVRCRYSCDENTGDITKIADSCYGISEELKNR